MEDERQSSSASRKNKATYRPPRSPDSVSLPDRSSPGRVPLRRVALWLLIAAVLIAGLVFFFRYADSVSPVLGGGR